MQVSGETKEGEEESNGEPPDDLLSSFSAALEASDERGPCTGLGKHGKCDEKLWEEIEDSKLKAIAGQVHNS